MGAKVEGGVMQNEKRLQKDLQYSLGCAFKGHHYIRVTHPDMYEESGKPDLIGHIYGMHVEIELKVSPNRPSDMQKEQIHRVSTTGGFACVIVWHKKDDIYYLVPPENVADFSYRDRKKLWWRLKHAEVSLPEGKRRVINLSKLYIEMTSRLQERYSED